MIQGFGDYEKTETTEYGERTSLKLGGHVCKVLGVETETTTSQKDGKTYNKLKVKFDIEAPDEQAGFYQKKFVEAAKKDAMTAKWKGYYNLVIPNNESADFAKKTWKTFLTSIEKSNPGVKIDGSKGFDENILIGKVFGGIFGLEEMTLPLDGKTIAFTRIRFARSTENIEEAPIPSVKLLSGEYMKYEDYKELKANGGSKTESDKSEGSIFEGDSDDLPF